MNLLDTLITATVFFCITLLAHIFICRLGSSANLMLKGVALGSVSSTICAAYMLFSGKFNILGPYILFSAWLFYLMVLINLLNSVTLKMLASLYRAPTGTLSAQDFGNTFNTEDGFETRLAMLHCSKLIEQQGASITLTPKARSLLLVVHHVKTVLSID